MSEVVEEIGSGARLLSSGEERQGTDAAEKSGVASFTTVNKECDASHSDTCCFPNSPTRAPEGWSLSLSLSRAKRALEVEEQEGFKKPRLAEEVQSFRSDSSKRLTLSDLHKLPIVKLPKQVETALDVPCSVRASATQSGRNSPASDLEEGEVPPSPTRIPNCPSPPQWPVSSKPKPAVSFINDDDVEELQLKVVVLEQQVSSLRKSNEELTNSLKNASKSKEKLFKEELKKLNKNVEIAHTRIASAETKYLSLQAALLNENEKVADLEEKNKNLKLKLEKKKKNFEEKLEKKNKDLELMLEKKNKALKLQLEIANDKISSLTNQKAALRDQIANYKIKIDNQRANLTGLENQLIKSKTSNKKSSSYSSFEKEVPKKEQISSRKCHQSTHCSCQHVVLGLEIEVSDLRGRIKNQTSHLASLNAAFDKIKLEVSRAQSRELELKSKLKLTESSSNKQRQEKRQEVTKISREWKNETDNQMWKPAENCELPKDSMGAHLFEKKVFRVISDNFLMAKSIMQNFEETAYTLPALRPAFRAAIAAMPPATRTLCLGEVMALLPSVSVMLANSKAVWYDDPSMKDSDPARMALFWGYQTAWHLTGVSRSAGRGSGPAGPNLSVWSSPLTLAAAEPAPPQAPAISTQVFKALSLDQNANVTVGSGYVAPGTAANNSPVKKEQVPDSAPASSGVCAGRAAQQAGAKPDTCVKEEPVKEEPVEVEGVGAVCGGQRLPGEAMSPASVEAARGPAGSDADVRTVASAHPGDADAAAESAVTEFLQLMYQATRESSSCLSTNQASCSSLSELKPTCPGPPSTTGNTQLPTLVSYPPYLYEGMKYQSNFVIPSHESSSSLDQFGCELPPHLQQRQEGHQQSILEENSSPRPPRISFNVKELKKRINIHLKPGNQLDPDTQ